MDQTSPQTPQLKRFQLSLKALFAAMVGASIYLGFLIAHSQVTGAITLAFLLVVCLVLTFLKGFYWLGLCLMLFVGLIFFNAFANSTTICTKSGAAKSQIEKISMALTIYEGWFRDYPPNTLNGNSAAELYQAIEKPKLAAFSTLELRQSGATIEVVSPWGFPLHYQRTIDAKGRAGFVVIATGADGLLGGTLSEDKGFVPDSSDANGDGAFDHEDNIISEIKP